MGQHRQFFSKKSDFLWVVQIGTEMGKPRVASDATIVCEVATHSDVYCILVYDDGITITQIILKAACGWPAHSIKYFPY